MARKVAERFPGSVDAQSAYAELAGRGGDLSASYAALARAHKAAPNDVNTTLRYALVAGAVGKHAEAIATLGKLAAARPKDAAVHYHLGYLLLRDEGATAAERKRAEEELKTAVTLDPKKAEYVAQLGVARMLQGEQRFGEAQRAFDQALTLDPKSIPAHMGVATIAQNNKRWDAAAAAYRAALAVQPGNDYARRQLAGVLLSAGKRDEAYREFWDLATRNPKDTRYLKELGAYLLLDQNWQTARSAYQTVLERDPKDADAMVGVARTLEKEERGGEAEKMYLAAIAAQPKNPTAYYLLAERYETAKQPEKAKPLYEKLTAIDPENPSARWNLARYFMDKNTPEGDKRALEMMRQIRLRKGDPLRTDYMLGPATLMMARGRYDDAVTEVRKVLKAEPENIELQYALANALARAKQGDEAVEILQGLVKKAPRDEVAKAKGALAQAYEVLGRPDDAAKVYEEILAADALLAPARDALVNLRAAQNRPDAAAEFLERLALAGEEGPNMDAVNSVRELYTLGPKARPELYVAFAKRVAEKYPKRPEALGNAATAILKWNNPGASPGPAERQAALDLYRRAAEIDPKDPEARFQMALQLEALGKKDEAVAAFQETLRLDPNSQGAVNALKRLGVAAPAPSAAPGGGGANGGEKQGRQ
jgi:tetratricopeptide (TPR) repeat protein